MTKTTEQFSTPIKVAEGVWIVGRLYTKEGRFLRTIRYYGNNPKSVCC